MTTQESLAIGQRWLSETEPDLGLGIITELDFRTVTVLFRASDETRRYARQNAPLNRFRLNEGDTVSLPDLGDAEICEVTEGPDSTLLYIVRLAGREQPVPEAALPDNLSANRPLERLLAGQISGAAWFTLKKTTLELRGAAEQSGLMGLCSARTELIPHQLYIADEVARRYAPRVMLADEVGLGKTIEAGLILQQQLVAGLAQRVLILVPDALLHQWLVEMLRRFNLHFTVLDRERWIALQAAGESLPFRSAQLILTPLSLLIEHGDCLAAAAACDWDLCIIDEAHHISLGELTTRNLDDSRSSPEQHEAPDDHAAGLLAHIASASKGLLLLTATPEQLGPARFFSLLQLLDPARFRDFQQFQDEQARYQQIADQIDNLPAGPGHDAQRRVLLDQYGTGRVLFRNTRRALNGFPVRQLTGYPLTGPVASGNSELPHDVKVVWLVEWLQQHNDKVLLICAEDATAITLEKHLRLHTGVRAAVFHRNMSILERDRAAAYFASEESAARILVCSEIGSEGRNFQFCSHLVLFDLPENPDLLEQRIGRLDRIGQRNDVHIHVPYHTGSRQEVLLRWYNEGLNAFTQIAPAAWQIWQEHKDELQRWLQTGPESADFDDFLERVQTSRTQHNSKLEAGRDRLLDMNSHDEARSAELLTRIRSFENNLNPQSWLCDVLDHFGVFTDTDSDGSYHIIPSDDMLLPVFPGLPDAGIHACFQRSRALFREDQAFVSWQHPMVTGAFDLLLETPYGKACVSQTNDRKILKADSILKIELLYRISVSAPAALQLSKYLPCTAFTIAAEVDADGEISQCPCLPDNLRNQLASADAAFAMQTTTEQQNHIRALLDAGSRLADGHCADTIGRISKTMLERQTDEIKRLLALRNHNPNIRDDEINYLKEQTLALHKHLSQAQVELVALHLIIPARFSGSYDTY